jgi:hypothetical protein
MWSMELFFSKWKTFTQFTTYTNTLTNNKEKEKIKCKESKQSIYTKWENFTSKKLLKKTKLKGDKLIELGEKSLKFTILRLE